MKRSIKFSFFSAVIEDEKGNTDSNFYALNILSVISCMDKERSVFEEQDYYGVKSLRIKKLYIIQNSLNHNKITRLREDNDKIIVIEELKKRCEDAKLKGLDFVPEGYSIYTDI